jgi:hypothetical protein
MEVVVRASGTARGTGGSALRELTEAFPKLVADARDVVYAGGRHDIPVDACVFAFAACGGMAFSSEAGQDRDDEDGGAGGELHDDGMLMYAR